MKIFKNAIAMILFMVSPTNAAFTPVRIPFEALQTKSTLDDGLDSILMQALIETGMISVTNLPSTFQDAMKSMIATQEECILQSSSLNTQVQTCADGTVRTTIATHTVPGVGGKQPLFKNKDDVINSEPCITFEDASKIIRSTTQDVVYAFATKLTALLRTDDVPTNNVPLLVTKGDLYDAPYAFNTVLDVIENGEHLEHFHTYKKLSKDEEDNDMKTIELHTDQGLFLVFTPGRYSSIGTLTNGFYIETAQGVTEEVHFSSSTDELVIMLGDGVNQVINHKIQDSEKQLRAVPHSVVLESSNSARIWYGLMVLPPSAAIHPLYTDTTFGQIRHGLLMGNTELISMACTSTTYNDFATQHRMLDGNATTCENVDEVYCWHRCMSGLEFGVSAEMCTLQNKTLACINPRFQISTGESHGDYYPACAGSDWVNETEFETVPNYPRDEGKCGGFEQFYDDNKYMNSIPLKDGVGAIFQYNLTSDGYVRGRLAYNGLFGYLSVGFIGEGRLIMFNAPVVIAMPGGNYTAQYGLDLDLGYQIDEFITHPNKTSFRHWSVPYDELHDGDNDHTADHNDEDGRNGTVATERSSNGGSRTRMLHNGENHTTAAAKYSVMEENDGCYTALYLYTKSIAGKNFNVSGTDTMIWGANSIDIFMGYHGVDRGNFTIDWTVVEMESTTSSGGSSAGSTVVRMSTTMSSVLFTMITTTAFFIVM